MCFHAMVLSCTMLLTSKYTSSVYKYTYLLFFLSISNCFPVPEQNHDEKLFNFGCALAQVNNFKLKENKSGINWDSNQGVSGTQAPADWMSA